MRIIIFLLVTLAAFSFLFHNLRRLYSYLKVAKPENRWDNVKERINHMLLVAFGQSKILRDKSAGPLHVAIFWGFLVFLLSAAESVVQGFFPRFSLHFLGPIYTLISFLTDLFSVLIMVAVVFALSRRFITKVPRLQLEGNEKWDALTVLMSIFVITFSVFMMNTAIEAIPFKEPWAIRPFAMLISGLIPWTAIGSIHEFFWWLHILAIYAFMNYLPYSKHLHVYTSIQNVFLSPINIPNKLEKIDFEAEGVEKFGVSDIEDFTWKPLLDGYSCTHCGRCDSVCPANTTGKVLSPRRIYIEMRQRTLDKAPILIKQKINSDVTLTAQETEQLNKKFIGDYQSIEALWQCTTCAACMQECPVTIEHVPAIVDMRRSLVMMEANFPTLLQTAFSNLENNGSPWAFSSAERADWAEDLNVKIASQNPEFEVLFWVGCAGSFDDRAKKVSVAMAKLMQKAGVDFAILGTEETCNGDVARRAGNEYLADMLIKQNIETMAKYNFKKIVTFCPHCFNTLKNEYPDFGINYEVIHHTQFLKELLSEGKLKLKPMNSTNGKVVYHDSCYLGRYNHEYDAPRNIISSLPRTALSEVERSRDKGFCCGAGGAQMFMEETEGKRVNIERTEELLEKSPDTIAVNCPFCMTMMTDGVKAKDKTEDVAVKDVAELLLEKVQD